MGVSEREIAAVFGYIQGTEIPVWVDDICERFRSQGIGVGLPNKELLTQYSLSSPPIPVLDSAPEGEPDFIEKIVDKNWDKHMGEASPDPNYSLKKPYDRYKQLEDEGKTTQEIAVSMGAETQTVYGWRSRYKKEKESHAKIES